MALALLITGPGTHVASWRHPDARAGKAMDFEYFKGVAQAAERACYDMLFLADNLYINHRGSDIDRRYPRHAWPEFEPLTLLAALSTATNQIGLAATISTTYSSPYTTARAFASLDHLSGGRAGWNVVTSQSDMEASNFGFDLHAQHVERYARAAEYVDVVRKLWDSWEEDALIADKKSGIALDATKMHTINHDGPFYKVQGPLNISRPPQGHPLIIQAGSSDAGQDVAASVADIVFTAQDSLSSAQKFYASLKGRVEKLGRSRNSVVLMPGIFAIVGETEHEAKRKFDALQDLIDPVVGVALLSNLLGANLEGIDVDMPLPPIEETNASKSRLEMIRRMGADEHLTAREIYTRMAPARGHLTIVGSAERVADTMAEWCRDDAADGFMLVPGMMPQAQDDFDSLVLPILRQRGLLRTSYVGSTLREHLGLAKPANAFRPD